MSQAGDTIENPITKERVVVRVGTEDSGGELLAIDMCVKPGGAVTGEHVHPAIEEYFTVVRGRVGFKLDGRESIAELNQRLHVPAGTAHDWWNAGEEEAHVVVAISPAERFEKMVRNLFGLAQDGKANSKGMPNLLQAAIFAREFSDVLYFTKPPLLVQRLLFGTLAAIAQAIGYRGSYPKYSDASEPRASGEVAGPPSTKRLAAGAFAVACSLLVASLLLLRGTRRPPNVWRRPYSPSCLQRVAEMLTHAALQACVNSREIFSDETVCTNHTCGSTTLKPAVEREFSKVHPLLDTKVPKNTHFE